MGDSESRKTEIFINGKTRTFDVDDPDLPDWVEEEALASGNFPYRKKLSKKKYEKELYDLQKELVKVQYWLQATGGRVMALFEGRDAAGKGGTIAATLQYMNPRSARAVALSKPTEKERTQWYFQRYVEHFPSGGEFVAFDRSWYNRAGVEPVMGFCTPEEHRAFLKAVPNFEQMIVNDDIHFFKFWLNIGREMQLKRFHDRANDPLKTWKLSPMDIAALNKWDDYTQKRDQMMLETHSGQAPWTVVRANDKRRARLNVIRHILLHLQYDGKDREAIGEIDHDIIGQGPDLLD
ncbi:polyphosphate kinase 2 [Rhizobium sp. L1K21]|uniref:polyphosphate kinase 2 n=1 Tax=Rhizobium sp. L1K21 TaxID=2954933 RepID=UPI002093EA59|nr:polyphosphate kinase 2 [Rhizobium sp. L1K21]MCO6187224.1 polyphosphate kinase 2 [Rhizobium sp. L1K21]